MKRVKVAVLSVATLAALSGSVALSATAANAQTTGDSLVERLASRFNLNKDDVQAVFDEEHDQAQTEHLSEVSEDLQDKVDSGDITADQKTLIENKLKELQDKREAENDELKAWAEQNGIDMKYLFHGPRSDNRLDNAVEDGDITADQKTLIEQKQDELETRRKTQRDELEQWAKDNGIDLEDIHIFGGHGRGHGPMM